jgi:hypothetical protein
MMYGKQRTPPPGRREGLAAVLATVLALALVAAAGASRAPAYCTIPTNSNPPWGFRVGQEITGATGTYAHGHGDISLTAHTVSGVICEVDRVAGAPDRQIILSVDRRLVSAVHGAILWGVPGNLMKIDVRVQSSTDPKCPVGTAGEVALFASYNGVHRDSVQLSFPAACARHRHLYRGADVVTNVPPE